MKIGLIGAGKMGEAVVAGVTKSGVARPEDVRVFNRSPERAQRLAATHGVRIAESPRDAIEAADFAVFAVKPQDFEAAARPVAGSLSGATALSVMAGVPLARLCSLLGTQAAVRAMPNTPAMIGEGMTVWTATAAVAEESRSGAAKIFAALGREAFVPEEKYLDMATGLSGSGPAYVFLFLEALTDAGVHIGLSQDLARSMALQTLIGSARYAEATGIHPAQLRNQVTSPAGTTAEGLRALEAGRFRATVLEAVIAAYDRSRALGEETKK